MKCQTLLSRRNMIKMKISSTEFAHSKVSVK